MPKTWKEIKQAYLLTLIKHGDLSRGHLDSLIGEAQRMTSDRGILQADNVEDMRRVVEVYDDMGSDKSKRMIIVMDCGHCPLSRLMRIKDGPFCDHQATDGMSVGEYSDRVHPDCPLRRASK